MPQRRIRPIARGVDSLRIALELLGLMLILLTTPLALLLTPRGEFERSWPLWVSAYVLLIGFVAWDVTRTIRTWRHDGARPAAVDRPGKDTLWDRKDAGRATWRGLRAVGFPFAPRTSGAKLREAMLRASWAVPLGASRPDVVRVAEDASLAVGLPRTPALYWSRGGGTNAAVAGDPQACLVILGEEMLASFSADELLGVFAALLSRVEHGAANSVTGRVGKSVFTWPSERAEPGLIVDAYRLADAAAVLALRDSAPVVSALRKTAQADPFLPGLTVDQAQLMWTWPSSAAPWVPGTTADMVQGLADMAFAPDVPLGPRVETLRLEALEDAGAAADGPVDEGLPPSV